MSLFWTLEKIILIFNSITMSDKLSKVDKEFDDDVVEYKQMEQEVAQNFLQGVIKLGEILQRQRDKWKSKGRWMEYLDVINKHVSGANQFIRIFEYSDEHMKQLVVSNLTNWNKVNMFLALPEELREELSDKIDHSCYNICSDNN